MGWPLTEQQRRSAPPGWEDVEPLFADIAARLRAAELRGPGASGPAAHAAELLALDRERSRLAHDLFWVRHAVSRRLYDWMVSPAGGGVADRELVAKWRRAGYERLCCLRCIQASETAAGNVCVCRVPRAKLSDASLRPCVHCGCLGCGG